MSLLPACYLCLDRLLPLRLRCYIPILVLPCMAPIVSRYTLLETDILESPHADSTD